SAVSASLAFHAGSGAGRARPDTSYRVVASPSAAAPPPFCASHSRSRLAVAARPGVLPIAWSPRLRLRLPGRFAPRTLARAWRWPPGPAYFLSRGRLAFGCGSQAVSRLALSLAPGSGRPDRRTSYRVVASPSAAAPRPFRASPSRARLAVDARTGVLPIAWSPRLRLRLPLHSGPIIQGANSSSP